MVDLKTTVKGLRCKASGPRSLSLRRTRNEKYVFYVLYERSKKFVFCMSTLHVLSYSKYVYSLDELVTLFIA